MKALLRCLALCAVMALGFVPAATASTNKAAGFRLTVEMRDGSRVIGKSKADHFEFRSDVLGEMKLPLQKIRFIESQSQTNVIKLTTAGNDLLTAAFDMETIRLETAFGEVKLPVSLIKTMRVSVLGAVGRPTDGLIGLWSAEGNAVDSVGGHNGVLRNVSFTDGVAGQAFLFAPDNFPYGTYTGVQIADKPEFALTHSLTIEGWIRPRGNGYLIFFRGDHRPGLDPYHLSLDGNLNLEFGVCGSDNNDAATVRTHVDIGAWIHVAGVLDDSTGTMSLYTNGVLAAQTTTAVRPFGALLAEESPGIGIGNVNDGGNNFPFIGEIDEMADHANLGVVIDSFHMLANRAELDGIDDIPSEKIAMVQLSDFMWRDICSPEERLETARHLRVFPGEGAHSQELCELLRRLDRSGYRGDYSFEVFNDDYLQLAPAIVAQRALRSAKWVTDQVLRRSLPVRQAAAGHPMMA